MKKIHHCTWTGIVLMLFLFSCQETLTDAKIAEIEKEITEINELTLKGFEERDSANTYKYYSDHFTLLSSGEYKVKDPVKWKEYMAAGKETVMTRAMVTYEVTESRVEVLSPTVANQYFTYYREIHFGDTISFGSPTACTFTYLKEDEGWKIRSAHISYPIGNYRAKEGDKVWVLENKIKTDKKEMFEEFMYDKLLDKASETNNLSQFLASKIRILHPVEENEDGTSTYFFIMDPLIEGANYNVAPFVEQIYGKEESIEVMKMWTESFAAPQKGYMMIQSKH